MEKQTIRRLATTIIIVVGIPAIIVSSIILYPHVVHRLRLLQQSASAHAVPENPPVSTPTYGYVKRTFTNGQGENLVYYFYIPAHYNPDQKYPLVLLLHGGGEKSNPKNTPAQNQEVILKQLYVQIWTSTSTAPGSPEI